MQSMKITQPAGSCDATRSTNGSPQVCHPLALAQPILWIRIRYPVQPLMHAVFVVPAHEFNEYTPKMPFIPDQQAVEISARNGHLN
jgi:hypothetical protein